MSCDVSIFCSARAIHAIPGGRGREAGGGGGGVLPEKLGGDVRHAS